MTRAEKLVKRFKNKPKDFTFYELIRLLSSFGYKEKQGAGSRIVFVNKESGHKIKLHKPHPENMLKRYQLDLIEIELKQKGWL